MPPAELTATFPRRGGSRLVAATVRRVLARVDADALDRAIGAWLAAQ